MVEELRGTSGSVAGNRFAIVVSKYHNSITQKLLDGAIQTLRRNLVPANQIRVYWVPGAWEIPNAVQKVLGNSQDGGDSVDAVLTFGCVVQGETTHDQHINTTVSNSLGRISLDYQIPVAFGVLTVKTMDQAIQRSGGDVGNKGVEVAEAAIHMLLLFKEMEAG
ncbi:MAG: 6,7-dimethyl-8-ribityllumazine synthase [Mariniblastus sp.]|nr:6,7-dimethyl-8-ribityllumazine synthase [Mariniblastus sp.]